MRTIASFALLLCVQCLSLADTVKQVEGVQAEVHTAYYEVTGDSVHQLHAQMSERGPVEKDGKRYFAKTDWLIKWQYRSENRQGRAVLTQVSVSVDVKYELPHWPQPATAGGRLSAEWTRFSTALMTHERGHADNALQHAKKLDAKLRKHGPFANREAMEAFVAEQGNQCVAEANAADLEYDRRTGHGAKQGAKLNVTE